MSESGLSPAMVDLNQADLKTLMTLPGITRNLAQQIIEYREKVRPFTDASEILVIQDISENIYQDIMDKVVVSLQDHQAIGASNVQEVEEEGANLTDMLQGQFSDAARIIDNDDEELQLFDVNIFSDDAEGSEDVLTQAETVAAAIVNQDDLAMSDSKFNEDTTPSLPTLEAQLPFSPDVNTTITRKSTQSIWSSHDFWNPWLLLTVGILGGTILTLLILQAVNGTLVIEKHPIVEDMNTHLSSLENQNMALRSELEAMQDTLGTYADQHKQDNQRLQEAEIGIQSLLESSRGLSGQTALLEENMISLVANMDLLNESLQTLDQDVIALSNNNDRVMDLDQAVTGLRGSLNELSGDTSSIVLDITALKDNTNSLKAGVDALQDDIDRVNDFLFNLRGLLQASE